MASGTIHLNEVHRINITGTVVDGVITVDPTDIPGTPILVFDGGGWNWSISRHGGNWKFMGFSMSGSSITHPANGERTITVTYLYSVS